MFRFTIRDMLWLTVVVALAVGWWGQRRTALEKSATTDSLRLRNDELLQRAVAAEAWMQMQRRVPGYLGMVPDEELKGVKGVRVLSVKPGTPADKSGLKTDDLVTGIDGKLIANLEDMDAAMKTAVAGQKMRTSVQRSGKTLNLEIILGTRPAAVAGSYP